MHLSCKDRSRHFHQMIVNVTIRDDQYMKIIDVVIQRNLYLAHSENVILAMITDHRPHMQ